MAILKEIEASVIIDGNALTEYDDEDTLDESSEHTSEVSKYIEAVSGAEFSIGLTVPKSYNFRGDALSFKTSLDGVYVESTFCREAKLKNLREDWHKTVAGSEVKNGTQWYLRPFKFGDIKIGETSLSYQFLVLITKCSGGVNCNGWQWEERQYRPSRNDLTRGL